MAKEKEYFFEYKFGFMTIIATIIMIVAIVVTIPFMGDWGSFDYILDYMMSSPSKISILLALFICIVVIFLWGVLHELIHGWFYILGGAKRKNITYGAALEKGVFYCRCGEYVNKKTIMSSLMAPFTIIGVITLIIGFITKQWWLVLLSGMNIGGAGADLCMFFFFLKRKDDVMFMEYGDSLFFSLKTSEDLENKEFKCVKLIDKDNVPANDNKFRLVISKGSYIVFGIIVLLLVVALLFNI